MKFISIYILSHRAVSRIGKQPVQLPEGVTVRLEGDSIIVTGKKGELSLKFDPTHVDIAIADGVVTFAGKQGHESSKFTGLIRSTLSNMVEGVAMGYKKELVILGVGYKAQVKGKTLALSLGFSHPVEVNPPEGIAFTMNPEDPQGLFVEGIDKVLVGQVAAEVRSLRPPEPYKGKGIRYRNEYVIRKAGKSAGK